MLQLIEHIIRISSKRDRTEINSALVDAMRDMFDPSALTVYRCYPCTRDTIVFACAGLGPPDSFHTTPICRNAVIDTRSTTIRCCSAARRSKSSFARCSPMAPTVWFSRSSGKRN
jgi:hypothetical protein